MKKKKKPGRKVVEELVVKLMQGAYRRGKALVCRTEVLILAAAFLLGACGSESKATPADVSEAAADLVAGDVDVAGDIARSRS